MLALCGTHFSFTHHAAFTLPHAPDRFFGGASKPMEPGITAEQSDAMLGDVVVLNLEVMAAV